MVRRRWLVVLPVVVLVPLAVVFFSLNQHPRYRATAEVLLSSNLRDFGKSQANAMAAQRAVETEAELAAAPQVARAAMRAAGVKERSARDFLRKSSVTADPNANLLRFRVSDRNANLAVRLATQYARAFTQHRRRLSQAAIEAARSQIQGEIRSLKRKGRARGPLYRALTRRANNLERLEALQTGTAVVATPADHATRLGPRPVRYGIIAAGGALIVAVLLAFLVEALDTRLRSADEVTKALGLPLLGRLQKPGRRLRRKNRLAMLHKPNGAEADSFRVLRSNVDFFNLEFSARTIMVTSALPREGKSTIAANLAIAFARSGRRVALVDLDLRRPSLDRFFRLGGRAGVSDAALGRVSLREALAPVEISGLEVAPDSNGRATTEGSLEVMPPGSALPNVGEFVSSPTLGAFVSLLRSLADIVIIDGPPLLGASDGMVLGSRVDALLIAVRLKKVRRATLNELRRLLDASSAYKLGVVVSGAELDREYWTTIPASTETYDVARSA